MPPLPPNPHLPMAATTPDNLNNPTGPRPPVEEQDVADMAELGIDADLTAAGSELDESDTDDEADDDAESAEPDDAVAEPDSAIVEADTRAAAAGDIRARIRAKVREFPRSPGVYLIRDDKGRVLYVGKAKSLRNRVYSYFQPNPDHDPKIASMVAEAADVDFVPAESEADALLIESRLIKDIQPRYNKRQRDDKTFPYIEITTREDFPGVYLTRTPAARGTRLYGPFTSVAWTREAISTLQRVFQYRTCTMEIRAEDDSRRHFRPCLLAHIGQCTAPCADRIGRDDYRRDIERFKRFLEGDRRRVLEEMRGEMTTLAGELRFEEAKRVRDQIRAVESLAKRGTVAGNVQPELFQVDPAEGLRALQRVLGMTHPPRAIEGIDIAHLQGNQTVGSLVSFLDGRPHKAGYRKFRVRTVAGVDDFGSIREVVARRYGRLGKGRDPGSAGEAAAGFESGDPAPDEAIFPDVVLIDGGLGQLHAALEGFAQAGVTPPKVVGLAKREEEIFLAARSAPVRLPRNSPGLRLLQYIRDEAHRFAQHYHHILRSKSAFAEQLKEVRRTRKRRPPAERNPGSGPADDTSQ